jgi:hypothetical protein
MLTIEIITPSEYTAPLAHPNPRLVGGVGERALVFGVWFLNTGPNAILRPDGSARSVLASFGGGLSIKDGPEAIEPGKLLWWQPNALSGFSIPIDSVETGNTPDGEYVLTVSYAGAQAAITVRVDKTDLHLVGPWPGARSTNDVAREELAAAHIELEQEMAKVTIATGRIETLKPRIQKLEEFLK